MLRVVERVLGEGEGTREGVSLGRVAYELTLYREWVASASGLVPEGYEIDGHFMASPEQLDAWTGTRAPLTLHLDDGRLADVYLVNLEGVVTPADARGFYAAGGTS